MARYSVVIDEAAEAELRAIPFPFRRQLNQRIFKLMDEPRPEASELIEADSFRLRAYEWVLLYEVDDERQMLTVLGFRKDTQS